MWGLLALFATYLQPYGEAGNNIPTNEFKLHPGFTANQVPYILAIAPPILGITIGAVAHSLTGSRSMRLVLWIATALMGVVALPGAISALAMVVVPAFLLGLGASLLARNLRSSEPDAARRAA
jgi:hypothetical protein